MSYGSPRVKDECCSVSNNSYDCEAPPGNVPCLGRLLVQCYKCGGWACRKCSAVEPYLSNRRCRLCDDCRDELNREDPNRGKGKLCPRCGETKDLDAFRLDRTAKVGRQTNCKQCADDINKARLATDKAKALHVRYQRAWKERNRQKTDAHEAVNEAVRTGRLSRLPCEVCGKDKSQGHHPDYSKPLEVRWLCSKHHAEVHNAAV